MRSHATPTIGESMGRLWQWLPWWVRILIPTVSVLLIVLLPANALISQRFVEITTDNLRTQHTAILAGIGSRFESFFTRHTLYLAGLAVRDDIRACAPLACADTSRSIFEPELASRLRDVDSYYVEIGFIDREGRQTARALRGSGGLPAADGAMLRLEPEAVEQLRTVSFGEAFVFPIQRDTRIPAEEAYQQPAVRIAMPVVLDNEHAGYVTVVLNLDDFFAQQFVPSESHELFMLDSGRCLIASADDSRRADLYLTWNGDPERPCLRSLPTQDWDITVQTHEEVVFSTRMIHGPLSTSGQSWTIVIQQTTADAYGQATALRALLTGAHLAVIVLVTALIIGIDRAIRHVVPAMTSPASSRPGDDSARH